MSLINESGWPASCSEVAPPFRNECPKKRWALGMLARVISDLSERNQAPKSKVPDRRRQRTMVAVPVVAVAMAQVLKHVLECLWVADDDSWCRVGMDQSSIGRDGVHILRLLASHVERDRKAD